MPGDRARAALQCPKNIDTSTPLQIQVEPSWHGMIYQCIAIEFGKSTDDLLPINNDISKT